MLKRAAVAIVVLAIVLAALAWFATAPEPLAAAQLPAHEPDVANGERVFYAGGCASCHAAPEAKGEDKLKLAGGLELNTPFGVFRVPNISPDPTGIGGWSTLDFVNAVTRGVSPGGAHYYPAFPYPSYARMRLEDAIDLKAFIDTLPPVANEVAGHELGFPYSIRRGVGLWKRLYLPTGPAVTLANPSDAVQRGQYLVEALGHCGECHTSRDAMGGLKLDLWLAGAPNPELRGERRGVIPNITPHEEGIGSWSESEIVDVLKTGFKPDFDTLGGRMAAVQENLAHLPDEDLQAIAAYLKAIPPLPDAVPRESSSTD
jgi:mono/diheme cytochrome c family protein